MNISKYRTYPQRSATSGSITSVQEITENLTGQLTASNTLTINQIPSSGGVQLTLNGMVLTPGSSGDYTLTNKIITFNRTDIDIGDVILVSYIV